MSLLEKMRTSILFDGGYAETLNESISRVDPRLFWFAYYSPAPWPMEDNWQLLFYLSILNSYSLLWDCGPHPVYAICKIYKRSGNKEYKEANNLCHLIRAFRTFLAHSCNEELYFNKKMHERIQSFLERTDTVDSQCPSSPWENRCRIIWDRMAQLLNYLERVCEFAAKDGIDKWLDAIAEYYLRNDHYLLHVLGDRYDLRLMDQQRKQEKLNEDKVKEWVRNNYKLDDTARGKDGYEIYRDKCRDRIPKKLIARDCPKPAIPLPFFRSITGDAQKFIIL